MHSLALTGIITGSILAYFVVGAFTAALWIIAATRYIKWSWGEDGKLAAKVFVTVAWPAAIAIMVACSTAWAVGKPVGMLIDKLTGETE